MNDEQYLEFRAWDKVNKHMIVDSPLSMATIMGNYVGKKTDFNGKSLVENYEIMQFAGLRDMNGKKYCKSDILQYNNTHSLVFRRVVTFHEGEFGYFDKAGEWCRLSEWRGFYSIIGNIYENPELLEAGHE